MIQEPETLYKLMALYMLNKVNFPLTNSQLTQFFLDKEYTTYFTLQQVLSEQISAPGCFSDPEFCRITV